MAAQIMASQKWLDALPNEEQYAAICKDLEFTRGCWDRHAKIDEDKLLEYKYSLRGAENYQALRRILDDKSYATGSAQAQVIASRARTQGCRFVVHSGKKGGDQYHEDAESTSSKKQPESQLIALP